MKELAINIGVFALVNLAAWFVFWCGGGVMFTEQAGLTAASGLIIGAVVCRVVCLVREGLM